MESNFSQMLAEVFVTQNLANHSSQDLIIKSNEVIIERIGDCTEIQLEMEEGIELASFKAGKPESERIDLGIQLLRGLAELERYGIIHGDIKLENALVIKNSVKLIDFGIVTQTYQKDGQSNSLTKAMYALGVSLTLLFKDGIERLCEIEECAADFVSRNPSWKFLSDLVENPEKYNSFGNLLEKIEIDEECLICNPLPILKLKFEAEGLKIIYQRCCTYKISGFVCSKACYRYSDLCAKLLYIQDVELVVFVCLNLTLGLCGENCKELVSDFLVRRKENFGPAIRKIIKTTLPYALNYNLGTLELIAFCFSKEYHIENVPTMEVNEDDDLYDKIEELTDRLGIKLQVAIVNHGGSFLLDL